MAELSGKVALITGASRGIGRAAAEQLAASGAAVVVNYTTRRDAAETVVASIEAAGGAAHAIEADIANLADIDRLFRGTLTHFGRLDIFVANAAIGLFAPFAEVTEADFDSMYAVNAKGTFFCLQRAARDLSDGGRIVCVSTIGTQLNSPGGAAYFGSKAAVEQYCGVLARELAPRGITVNTVSPGFTDTDMLRETGGADPEFAAEILAMTPLARLGRPADIASVICFLAGPRGAWINRQNLAADGGIISR